MASRFFACCSHSNSPAQSNAIAGREHHVTRDALLGLRHRAGQVAAAHAEFDRHEALIAFAKDIGRAGIERDRGKFAQRNIGVAAVGGWTPTLRLRTSSMLLRYSGASRTDDGELAVGLQQGRRRGAAQRGLHDVIDVVDAQTVARRLGAIDPDIQVRLPEHPERRRDR